MAERIKLTEKVLREAVPIVGRDYQIFDADVRGFAVCIYHDGAGADTPPAAETEFPIDLICFWLRTALPTRSTRTGVRF